MFTLMALSGWVTPAYAEDPEFLLSDLNVRLDLDKGKWHMSRWSTVDFDGKLENDPVLLQAWATPVQTPVKPAEGWGALYTDRIVNKLLGEDPKILRTEVQDVKGTKWAFVDASFNLGKVGEIALRGATTEIEGQNFHFLVIAPVKQANVAERERDKITKRLEFTKEVPKLEYATPAQNERMATKLPAGWRLLHEGELDAVGQRILKFGVEDVTGCWTAVRPRPGAEPDVMVTCPRPMHLGVVDDLSFADADEIVRKKFFGDGIEAGTPLALSDRTGFLYAPRDGLAFAVIPDSDQVSVTWALGDGPLGDQVRGTLASSTFTAPHAISSEDQMNYYLTYQWASPIVLCPLGCVGLGLLGVVGVGISVAARGRRARTEDDE